VQILHCEQKMERGVFGLKGFCLKQAMQENLLQFVEWTDINDFFFSKKDNFLLDFP